MIHRVPPERPRSDPRRGHVARFEALGTIDPLVEGLGHGALGHFWATQGGSVFELGGGDLTPYLLAEP